MRPGHETELDNFTPDEMRELYKKDPAYFDRLAAEAISEACIGETDEETEKLQRMQQTIDAQLGTATSQLERMKMMEKIFYGSVFDLMKIMESFSRLIPSAVGGKELPSGNRVAFLLK